MKASEPKPVLSTLHRGLRFVALLAVLILVAGMIAPYIRADFFRNRIHATLEQALGRKTEIGRVRYNVFTGPGFTVDDVLIAEDARVGFEPFAHVPEMNVTVSPWSLFTGSLRFSSLRLVEPSMNLARSTDGLWNVQLFLDRPPQAELPEIRIRDGRINFKSGDRKQTIYFGNVEADVRANPGQVRFNISGEPFRTDRATVHVGVFSVSGVWDGAGKSGASRFTGDLEMERTGIPELVRLFDGRDPGLRGFVSSEARLSGPVTALRIDGKLRLDDLSERLFRPGLGASALNYTGILDLPGQTIALTSGDGGTLPVSAKLEAARLLADPQWSAQLKFQDLGAAVILESARQMGMDIAQGLSVGGKLRGEVLLSRTGGLTGAVGVTQPELRVGDGVSLGDRPLAFHLTGEGVDLRVRTEQGEGKEPAGAAASPAAPPKGQVDAHYDLAERMLEVQFSDRAGSIAELKKVAPAVPLLHQFEQGVWRGTLGFRRVADQPEEWQGQIEVTDAVARFTGIAEPAALSFAAAIDGSKALARNVRGKVGKLAFAGDYRYDGQAPRPHRVNLSIEKAEVAELERLLRPSLARGRGFLGRLPFTKSAEPEWFAERKLEGSVRIGRLLAGDVEWSSVGAKLQWNGASARLSEVGADWGEGKVSGEVQVDLTGARPRYVATGDIEGLAYRGGLISLVGKLKSEGLGSQLLLNSTGEGTFEGERLQFSTEAVFDSAEGSYEFRVEGQSPRVKLSNLKVQQGAESLQGQGATQADGKLALELVNGRRQLRLLGSLTPAVPDAVTYPPGSVR